MTPSKAGTPDTDAGDDTTQDEVLTDTPEPEGGETEEADATQEEVPVEEQLARANAEVERLKRANEQHLREMNNNQEMRQRLASLEQQVSSRSVETPQENSEIEQAQADLAALDYRARNGDETARVVLRQQRDVLRARVEARDAQQFAAIPPKYRQMAAALYYQGRGAYGTPAVAYEALLGRISHQKRQERLQFLRETEKVTGKKGVQQTTTTEKAERPVSVVSKPAPKVPVKGNAIKESDFRRRLAEAKGDPSKRGEVLKLVRDIEARKVKVLAGQ